MRPLLAYHVLIKKEKEIHELTREVWHTKCITYLSSGQTNAWHDMLKCSAARMPAEIFRDETICGNLKKTWMHRDLRGECRSTYDGQLDLRFTGAMPIFHG
jgi:hypothetical protein